MRSLKLYFTTATSIGFLFLTACSGGSETASTAPSPAASVAAAPSTTPATAGHDSVPQAGGQVIESGPYHLEFVSAKEATGTHLDFYLQKGDAHTPIPNAKVSAQVQLPDGTQKSLDLQYDAAGKHYAALLEGKAAGEYKVAILSDISGEKVNGRFSFSR
jgi:hypothetical protein